ncbi:FAD-dependent oxidoreductase [Hydrocarboniphaga sp.]|uniref:FAD-dependent oxidoreductase n=1 Tax=Hydrocarboniphaga sp. TaxID=2033016 RepID=UPI003D0B7700
MTDETFDFIVVGSGAGSMCAALVLRGAGKSVLILEKAELVGGTTATSGGVMWIPNNRYMKAAGVPDSREQAIAYMDAAVGDHADRPGASRERRAAFVDAAPQMIDFLVEKGIRLRRLPSYPDHYSVAGASVPGRTVVSELFDARQLGEWRSKLRPGFLPLPANLDEAMQLPLMKRSKAAKKVLFRVIGRALADKLIGKQRVTAGAALQAQLLNAALKAGTEIRLQSPVTELIVEGGRVVGVITQKDGQARRIAARLGVLINAGGFARNQRMLDQYQSGVKAEWSSVIEEDLGEMIEAGQKIGAAVAQMDQRVGMQITLPPGAKRVKPNLDTSKPHCIVVDQSGVRYMRESGAPTDICRKMLERNAQVPAVPSYLIADSQYINTYMLAGSMPGPKKPQAWLDSKTLLKADSIDELATQCGIDAAALRATVERYNAGARRGVDEDFHRGEHAFDEWSGDPLKADAKTIGTIEQGPYYAMPMYPGDVSTFGGLVTDTAARVLRADGSVIAGLYATGTSTASVMGAVEGGPGGSIGPTMTWAYLAARHALAAAAS